MILVVSIIQGSYALDINEAYGKACTEKTERKICGEYLICHNAICSNCVANYQCSSSNNKICKKINEIYINEKITNINIKNVCDHKSLSDGINKWDIIAICLIFFLGLFSAISGIGGGVFNVFILVMVSEFKIGMAARLSTATIFGLAFANFINYLPAKHPYKNKPLIDYNLTLLMEPFTLAGTIFGVILNIILPDWLVTITLILLLCFVGIKIMRKWYILGRRDDNLNGPDLDNIKLEETGVHIDHENKIVRIKCNHPVHRGGTGANANANDGIINAANNYAINNDNLFVLPRITLLIICVTAIVIFSLLNGTKKVDGWLDYNMCSKEYWLLTSAQFVFMIFIGLIVGVYLYYSYQSANNSDSDSDSDSSDEDETYEVNYNKKNTFMLPFVLILGGLVAATIGIGGGTIKTPVMLKLNILPEVLVATSGFSLIFASASLSAQYYLFGLIPMDYSLVLMLTGFWSSICGHLFIGYVITKKGKSITLLLVLGILTFLMIIAASIFGIMRFVKDIDDGIDLGFKDFC